MQPQEQWQPPFELSDPKSEKEQTIVKAMTFNQQLLGFYKVLPLSISDDKPHFGVAELRHWLAEG
ncbi:hypothetical protein JCM19233_6002 [Vibrio astriarenae]|nr:hypothetical protein JCM19233_6002 [Vibrio sp. C7]